MLLLSPLLLLALLCLVPLVRRHLFPGPGQWVETLSVGFGASVGGLTLWMLLLGLLPGKALSLVTASVFPVAMWGLGLLPSIANFRSGHRSTNAAGDRGAHSSYLAATSAPAPAERWLILAVAGSLAASLIHSLYYPFVGEDELSRYAYFARLVFDARSIPGTVAGYPLLLPLGYAYAFFLGGGIHEHLAKIVSWGFAPAMVAATYWLASVWAGRRAGLAAAFTLAVTRLFVDWSPMGYVDIPTGLYFALAGGFASLWLQRRDRRNALLAGAAAGLALWTKQAGFAAAFSLGLVFFVVGIVDGERRRAVWLHGAAALCLAALVGLPWYARNVALGGWGSAVPGPGDFYYSKARQAPLDWVPFLTWTENFGYGVVPLYLGGILASLAMLFRSKGLPALDNATGKSRIAHYVFRLPPSILIQWAFILPYLALWWTWFSYDPRFLLTVLPFYAVLVGLGFGWLAGRVPVRPQPILVAALVGALLIGGTYTRLGGVYRLVAAPQATDQEKLLQYKPDVASTVAFLRQNTTPGQDRIYSMDPRLAYYLLDYEVTAGYPTALSQLAGYHYLVAGSWAFNNVYPRLGQADNEVVALLEDPRVFELLFTSELGTVKVYRVKMPSSQAVR